ncbi:hypothetical protein ABZ714_29485 [Streptomyces sp. NPDC006798]|uniref:hypothetical protein n=1 Tax=Streptomyces sp. NPDC006798 TaxID=3155462 RepID=UPI0033C13B85
MPTPSHPGPPPYPPPPLSPPGAAGPPARSRNRRSRIAVITVALCVLSAGTAVWWLTRDDGSPLADRPRVEDEKAGISYAIPEGWRAERKGLIEAFTSAVVGRGSEESDGAGTADGTAGGEGGEGGSLFAGRAEAVPGAGLRRETERAASSNAGFFCPDGRSALQESKATTVDGRPAHTVVVKVTGTDCGKLHLRLNVVSVDDSRSAFLLGVTDDTGAGNSRLIDDVLADMSLS